MAINAQELQGQWNKLRGQVKEKWGQLTDDDLQIQGGNVDQLVGKIQQKTGEGREAIEKFLGDLTSARRLGDRPGGRGGRATSPSTPATGSASSTASSADEARERLDMAEDIVRHNPGQSVAAAFGVGLVGRRGRRPGPPVALSPVPRPGAIAVASGVPVDPARLPPDQRGSPMLRWAIAFAIIALIAGALGFYGAGRHVRAHRQVPRPGLPGPVRDRPRRRPECRRRARRSTASGPRSSTRRGELMRTGSPRRQVAGTARDRFHRPARVADPRRRMQHFLYFLPDPHGHGSFRPTGEAARGLADGHALDAAAGLEPLAVRPGDHADLRRPVGPLADPAALAEVLEEPGDHLGDVRPGVVGQGQAGHRLGQDASRTSRARPRRGSRGRSSRTASPKWPRMSGTISRAPTGRAVPPANDSAKSPAQLSQRLSNMDADVSRRETRSGPQGRLEPRGAGVDDRLDRASTSSPVRVRSGWRNRRPKWRLCLPLGDGSRPGRCRGSRSTPASGRPACATAAARSAQASDRGDDEREVARDGRERAAAAGSCGTSSARSMQDAELQLGRRAGARGARGRRAGRGRPRRGSPGASRPASSSAARPGAKSGTSTRAGPRRSPSTWSRAEQGLDHPLEPEEVAPATRASRVGSSGEGLAGPGQVDVGDLEQLGVGVAVRLVVPADRQQARDQALPEGVLALAARMLDPDRRRGRRRARAARPARRRRG